MQSAPIRILVLVALAAVVFAVAVPEDDEGGLIELLGAPAAAERDGAAREILSIGDAMRPALLRARRGGSSAAVRSRAGALLGVLEKTPPDRAEYEAAAARLALAARAAGEIGLVPPDLVRSLAAHATPATIAALADLVRDDRIVPSSGVEAARALELQDALPPLAPVLPALDAALENPAGPVRRAAAALLGALSTDDAAPLLRRADDEYAGVRVEIARALVRHGPATAGPLLERLAQDEDADVRIAALTALTALPGAPRPEPGHRAADDADPRVRAAAAELLARDAVPESRPVLALLADDPSPGVRAAADRALRAVAQR